MTRFVSGLATAITLFAAACTHQPTSAPPPVAIAQETAQEALASPDVPAQMPTARERGQRAIQLLDEGKEAMAMVELDAMLAMNPANATALKLQQQVQTDPEELLGESNIPYTVKSGETTSSLAQTYLGDALLFYALSRYNGLDAPNRLMAGQMLKMPDSFAKPSEGSSDNVVATSTAPEPVRSASAIDVAAANSLRLQALEQLNAGNTDGAVTLLQRARKLDDDNPNIAADLAKVERIQAALKTSS